MIKVNGVEYDVPAGSNLTFNNDGIFVNGTLLSGVDYSQKNYNIEVHGNAGDINTVSGAVEVGGDVHNVKTTSGDVACGSVKGDVATVSGDVFATSINGSTKTVSGDIKTSKHGM